MKAPQKTPKEQILLFHARRESLLILAVWVLALAWSVGSAYVLGYDRDPQTIALILGMPDWVFWSVTLPWGVCLVITVWFCFGFMADDDLGQDPDEGASHV